VCRYQADRPCERRDDPLWILREEVLIGDTPNKHSVETKPL
jgi:hypothetical protein